MHGFFGKLVKDQWPLNQGFPELLVVFSLLSTPPAFTQVRVLVGVKICQDNSGEITVRSFFVTLEADACTFTRQCKISIKTSVLLQNVLLLC